jgi:2-C-methyl-D-erythritol 4-phosphate cytidylyltransferase/2-C-methyl-D-erythritol 2,4-cyclodiphosphate synthase
MAAHTGEGKQFLLWQGLPLYWHCALAFAHTARICGIVFIFPAERLAEEQKRINALCASHPINLPWRAAAGGATRQESVFNGLSALSASERQNLVIVHDAVRPFVTSALINRILDALADGHPAVIPGIPVTDTIKTIANGRVVSTPDRDGLIAVQTPQGFSGSLLMQAHAQATPGIPATDDAALMERIGCPVLVVEGEAQNRKITFPEDLSMLDSTGLTVCVPCTGIGYDVHRFVEAGPNSRPLRLGGVNIPTGPHVAAHSDGDVLLHALADALLGCCAQGDTGRIFPDTDARFENMDSAVILDEALTRFHNAKLALEHVDIVLVAQIPKIAPYRDEIRKNLQRLLSLSADRVNVKATTEEGLGFTGEKKGIKATALVTATRHGQL